MYICLEQMVSNRPCNKKLFRLSNVLRKNDNFQHLISITGLFWNSTSDEEPAWRNGAKINDQAISSKDPHRLVQKKEINTHRRTGEAIKASNAEKAYRWHVWDLCGSIKKSFKKV